MKKRNPLSVCGNCPYWFDLNSTIGPSKLSVGNCKRYPPKESEMDIKMPNFIWPITFVHHYCGEHPFFWLEEDPQDTCDHNNMTYTGDDMRLRKRCFTCLDCGKQLEKSFHETDS